GSARWTRSPALAGLLLASSPEPDPVHQCLEARIVLEPDEDGILAQAREAVVTDFIAALQPLERCVGLATPRMHLRDLVGKAHGVLPAQRVERCPRGRVIA